MFAVFQVGALWAGNWILEHSVAYTVNTVSTYARLYQHYSDLQQKYNVLKKQFDESNDRRSQSESVFHDVRNTAHSICANSENLKSIFQKKHEDNVDFNELKKSVEVINDLSSQQMDIINQFLDISRQLAKGEETPKLKTTVFNLNDVFRATQRTYEQQLAKKELSLVLDVKPKQDIWVESNKTYLQQLLNNLIGNAIKFTNKGAGPITLKLEYPELTTIGEDIIIKVTVIDKGIGIKQQEQNLLFNNFSQANASIQDKFGGSGLGLVNCKKIAAALGGDIQLLTSEENVGSTFQFTIRCKTCQPKIEIEESNCSLMNATQPSSKRILVVDDNRAVRTATVNILDQLGYNCEIAENGKTAIELSKKTPFDIIFMDIQMPEIDGMEATRQIRIDEAVQKRTRNTYIIALSGTPVEGISAEVCIENGFNVYLEKPCKAERLKMEIERTDIENSVVEVKTKKIFETTSYPDKFFHHKPLNIVPLNIVEGAKPENQKIYSY